MAWRYLVVTLGLGAALGAGCFTNFEKVDGIGGAGGVAAVGGTGPGSGAGGVGGTGGACMPVPTDCSAATVLDPFLGGGVVRVTDAIRDGATTVLVGTFTGRVDFEGAGQQDGGTEGDGFLLAVDDSGNFVRFVSLPEADVDSEIYVDQHMLSSDLIVAGTFSRAPAACGPSQGIFVRRLMQDNSTVYALCVDGDSTTDLNLNDVHISEANYVVLGGDYRGTLEGKTAMGSDGFAISIDETGAVLSDMFVVGGGGDASVRAIEENFVGMNQWLIAGDFTGFISLEVPNLDAQTRDAGADRHLFVASYDQNAADSNLDLTSFGESGANHRLIDMRLLGPDQRDGVLLAEIEGDLVAGSNTITAPARAALALTFDVPSAEDMGPTFGVIDTVVMRGEALSVQSLQPRGRSFAISGQASGPVTLEGTDGAVWGAIPNPSCARDIFFVDIEPSLSSWSEHRCGEGQTVATAMAPGALDGFVTAIDLPAEQTISVGGTPISGPETLLLIFP